MPHTEQAQLRILNIVEAEPEISQRQLAERLGVSLGKTNYLIKALLDKGHLKAGNFMRAENKLKYAYLLTPEGIRAKLQLTRDYLARKEQEYIAMKAEIEAMRHELAAQDAKPQTTDTTAEQPSNT
ncbi:MAG: MarR family EPS-associated transcriptional regulator [Pseudomonadota bacterium]|nr:MarR family EPS-associated transcriptional regulator [Pseudomonadota bacterium]